MNDIEIDLIIETPSIDNYWLTQDSHWNDKTIEDTALNLIRTLKLDPFFSEKQIKRRLNDLDFINWNKINKYDKKTPNLIEYFSNKKLIKFVIDLNLILNSKCFGYKTNI